MSRELQKNGEEMQATNKMICPACGIAMNYHAEKIDYSASLDESSDADDAFGGVIEEVHSCPACGRTETRRE